MGMSLADLQSLTANCVQMEVCDHVPLRLLMMQVLQLLMLNYLSVSRWGSESGTSWFAYTGRQ